MSDSDFTRTLKAWHGSPHDFEEFRNDAIGSGEGTQWRGGYGIRGHGHYVAEERKVAESYRDNLHRRRNQSTLDETKFRDVSVPDLYNNIDGFVNRSFDLELLKAKIKNSKDSSDLSKEALQNRRVSLEMDRDYYHDKVEKVFPEFLKLKPEVQDYVRDMVGQIEPGDPLGSYTEHLNRLRENDLYSTDGGRNKYRELVDSAHEFMLPFLREFKAPEKKEGRLYELNLKVEPHELLDWDEELENHHKDALQKILDIPEISDHLTPDPDVMFDREDSSAYDQWMGDRKINPDYSEGKDIYEFLVDELGSAVKASNRLLEHGIKGIRYKDQGSRNNSQNTIRQVGDKFHVLKWDNLTVDKPDHIADTREAAEKWSLENSPPKPTYNYVIFDPTAIKIMRKLGMKGEVVKDFTDTGVHVKPVSHDPFKE